MNIKCFSSVTSFWCNFVPSHRTVFCITATYQNVKKIALASCFFKKILCDDHRRKKFVMLKHKISCHMHFKKRNVGVSLTVHKDAILMTMLTMLEAQLCYFAKFQKHH